MISNPWVKLMWKSYLHIQLWVAPAHLTVLCCVSLKSTKARVASQSLNLIVTILQSPDPCFHKLHHVRIPPPKFQRRLWFKQKPFFNQFRNLASWRNSGSAYLDFLSLPLSPPINFSSLPILFKKIFKKFPL